MSPDEAYRRNFRSIDWSIPLPERPRCKRVIQRSVLPCPYVIGDAIEVKSMVDGNIYTSKTALRQSYREKGYIEVGNEEMKQPSKEKPSRKAIRESVGKALAQVGL